MHFVKTLLYLSALLGFAMAQSVEWLAPPAGTTLTPGSNVTVALQMSGYSGNIDMVAVAIGLQSCTPACDLFPFLGSVLYQGSYAPPGVLAANFTVTVPNSFSSGAAILSADALYLVGIEFEPVQDYVYQNVTVS
ncbi:hypothetical protein EDD17DRAFT_867632 [Pisolithus thermaeus]|nr:hypothetical protein EV401DRAFT_1353619 [Pisolithus croceorrhizus]KAI6167859.1 hypothetical protein EDD17DRAFT_867632 [Pisolithus thermaeus]